MKRRGQIEHLAFKCSVKPQFWVDVVDQKIKCRTDCFFTHLHLNNMITRKTRDNGTGGTRLYFVV